MSATTSSTTGRAALRGLLAPALAAVSLGIPKENVLKLWTADMAGQKARLTVLNDNTDSTAAAKNAQKLITE